MYHDLNAIPLRNIIATWTACLEMAVGLTPLKMFEEGESTDGDNGDDNEGPETPVPTLGCGLVS